MKVNVAWKVLEDITSWGDLYQVPRHLKMEERAKKNKKSTMFSPVGAFQSSSDPRTALGTAKSAKVDGLKHHAHTTQVFCVPTCFSSWIRGKSLEFHLKAKWKDDYKTGPLHTL